jgi:hypothetical protein
MLFRDLAMLGDPDRQFADSTMMAHLPRGYLHRYTPLFARQFTACVATVLWKLAQH